MVGLVLAMAIIGLNRSSASALAIEEADIKTSSTVTMADKVVTTYAKKIQKEKEQKGPTKHTVKKGESLMSVAKQHNTTWVRLFNKNTTLTDPDIIAPGMEITIPRADEKLAERPLPDDAADSSANSMASSSSQRRQSEGTPQVKAQPVRSAPVSRGSSAGNRYSPGYCTWYVKNKRPDLPNNLGNANTWVSRARAQGMATGSRPAVGAVGQQGMHVVFVEAVHSNGTVTISEMNFRGLYTVSRRTVAATNFQYIY